MPLLHRTFPISVSLVLIDLQNPANPASLQDYPQFDEVDVDRQPHEPSSTTSCYIAVPPARERPPPPTPDADTFPVFITNYRTAVQFGVRLSVSTAALVFDGEVILFDVLVDGYEVARIALGRHAPLPPTLAYVVLGALQEGNGGVQTMHFLPLDVREDGAEGEGAAWERGAGDLVYRHPLFGTVEVRVSHAWGRTAPIPSGLSEISGFVHEVLEGCAPPLNWVARIPRRFLRDGQTHRMALSPVCSPDPGILSCTNYFPALPIHRTKHIGSITMHYRGIDSLCAGGILPNYRDAAAMSALRKQVITKLSRNQLVALVQWYKWRDERAARERQMAEQGKGKGRERMEDEGGGSASARGHTTGAGG